MHAFMVLALVALAGCATTSAVTDLAAGMSGARCSSIALQLGASPPTANAEGSGVLSIDPQVALTAYQLHCMKDTPLGL